MHSSPSYVLDEVEGVGIQVAEAASGAMQDEQEAASSSFVEYCHYLQDHPIVSS